ncbi:MAG: MATE family efflux transporter [Victivallales bacterium]|nr:MATE family efflux transporter [Victivallales bacterium]
MTTPLTPPYTLYTNKTLLNLIIPIIIDQILLITVGMLDTMMVAYLGDATVSGVSIVNMTNIFIGNLYYAMTTGGAVVAAQFLGAKQNDNARDSAKQLIFVAFTFAAASSAFCELFNARLLTTLYGDLAPDVLKDATVYFRYTALTYPILAIKASGAALLRAQNQSKYTMYASILTNLLNFVGNYLFIFVFKMGVRGAAIATLGSHIVSMFYVLWLLTDTSRVIYIRIWERVHLNWNIIKKILYIGVPSGIENSVFQLGRVLVIGVIAKFGTIELAANAVALSLDSFTILCGGGFGLAMITVIGQAVGASDEGQCRFYIHKMMKWSYIAHLINSAIILLALPLILKCFTKLTPEALNLARWLVLFHCICGLVSWPASFVFPNVLRACNDVRFTMTSSILSMFLVRVGLSYALSYYFQMGAIGVWCAMVADWIVRISCFGGRYLSNRWKTHAAFTS